MKKNAFSYVELIIAMLLIVALMAASGPLLSRRAKKATGYTAFGQYECWVVNEPITINNVTKNADVCYQRRVDNGYDLPEEAELALKKDAEGNYILNNDGNPICACTFSKPRGATMFKIQLVGGGAGGRLAHFNLNNANTIDMAPNIKKIAGPETVSCDPSSSDCSPIRIENATSDYINLARFSNADPLLTSNTDLVDFLKGGSYTLTKYLDALNITPGQGGEAGEVLEISLSDTAMPFENDVIPIAITSYPKYTDIDPTANNCNGICLGATAAGENPSSPENGRISYIFIKENGTKLPGRNCHNSDDNVLCVANGGDNTIAVNPNNNKNLIERPFGVKWTCVNGTEGKSPTITILQKHASPQDGDVDIDENNNDYDDVQISHPTPGAVCDNLDDENASSYMTCQDNGNCATSLTPTAATGMGSGGGGAGYVTDKRDNTETQLPFQLYLEAKSNNSTQIYKTTFSSSNTWTPLTNDEKCVFRSVEGNYTGSGGRSGGGGIIITW